ncbi:hypothetical protein D3C76_1757120 [compost metagenome]
MESAISLLTRLMTAGGSSTSSMSVINKVPSSFTLTLTWPEYSLPAGAGWELLGLLGLSILSRYERPVPGNPALI